MKLNRTERNGKHPQVWAQDEYCTALERGEKFTAHGDAWIYLRGIRIHIAKPPMNHETEIETWIECDAQSALSWIEDARAAIARHTR